MASSWGQVAASSLSVVMQARMCDKPSVTLESLTDHAHLCEQHEGIVGPQVLLQELHTVGLERGHRVLLGRVQCGHHSLWPDLHFI